MHTFGLAEVLYIGVPIQAKNRFGNIAMYTIGVGKDFCVPYILPLIKDSKNCVLLYRKI